MSQPIYELGGEGQVIQLAVANGFPPQVYEPLMRPFTNDYRVVSLLPRGLWPGEQPPENLGDWSEIADDMLAGMEQHHLRDVIAVGHSFGGVASILAAVTQPERFHALVLLDPTIFPPAFMASLAVMQTDGTIRDFPLVQGAVRRKRHWESVEAAYTYFKGKNLFSAWPDETVRLYAESGTRPAATGGVELAWPPEWEAYYFSTGYTKTWEALAKLRLPVLVIRGGDSDTFIPEAAEKLHGMIPEATYAEIGGHGHLFPQTAPEETGHIIREWLAGLA